MTDFGAPTQERLRSTAWTIVLVEPARGGNIGAAARAMKTMGFRDMRIVAGDTAENASGALSALHSDEARAFAHGSTEILDAAVVFQTLPEALRDCDITIATTGRRRGTRREFLTPDEVVHHLETGPIPRRVAVVFGPEERGLSNEELDACDIVSAVPMRGSYPSLNLGQAVMVYTYAFSPLVFDSPRPANAAANPESIHAITEKARALLPRIGFDPGRAIFTRIVERAALASDVDARLIHSVLNAIEIHLPEDPAS